MKMPLNRKQMKKNKEKIFNDALRIAKEKKCFFIEQLVSFLPIAKPTFYDYFPVGSNDMNAVKDILDSNRVEVKTAMYNKWFKSDAPALQIGLMKLIATDEEAHRLNGSKQEVKTETINAPFKGIDLSVKKNDCTD